MKSDVYFMPVAEAGPETRASALRRLLEKADPGSLCQKDEIVAVKVTIGDADCTRHVSPDLVAAFLSYVKPSGARLFVFDTNVIYKGERQNAVDHLNLARRKGFEQSLLGAPFIVADGLLGQDGREYEFQGRHIWKIKVPSFVGMLDSLFVLSHATGHIFTGYAGAIKNVAMGISCRPTKQTQHSSMKPKVIEEKCKACGCCVRICPVSAIALGPGKRAHVEPGVCIGCGECLCACKFDAIDVNWEEDMDVFCARLAETAHFILSKFKNKFFVTFAFDITQECDCISTEKDRFISRDIGILASRDILALDKATADMMTDEYGFLKEHDAYKRMFDYAAKIGLGSLDYQLVRM